MTPCESSASRCLKAYAWSVEDFCAKAEIFVALDFNAE
jgi:hypothetical protein